MPIRVLDKYTSDRIAAGEVVERPASVIKELVENALDAGAHSIVIEVSAGGLDYMRVTDDGCGIPHDEAGTAFLRHATSKITDSDDLAHIATLGFRGEALSSIAAVSRVELRTKTADEAAGTLVRLDAGDIKEISETAAVDGTCFCVSDLFYNVPARLKFIKSARAESAYISDYVSRMIMARPDVSFKLEQNQKTVYHSQGDSSLSNAIYCVYGADVMPHLLQMEFDDSYVTLDGFIGSELIGRANRTAQSFYINGRYIKSQKLSFALQRAYDTRLMTGKFPFAVINIGVDFAEVDVNVHPNKLDVRFKDEERIARAVVNAARRALSRDDVQEIMNASKPGEKPRETCDVSTYPSKPVQEFGRSDGYIKLEAMPSDAFSKRPVDALRLNDVAYQRPIPDTENVICAIPEKETEAPVFERQRKLFDEGVTAADYKIIGQIFDCYWIAQQGEKVFFIDQHAAHERRIYERIIERGVNTDSQLLLMPEIIKLTPYEFETLMSNIDAFNELGFDISEFGPLTVSVRAVPSILGAPQTASFLLEAIEQLDKKYRLNTVELKRSTLIRTACKRAIKAGEKPDVSEMAELLSCYEKEGIPMTCPHGRPVMIAMSKLEFEKLFKRVL